MGMSDTVGTLQTAAATPEKVRVRSEKCNAHGIGLYVLIRHIKKGLASVTVQQDICAHRPIATGRGCARNA